MSNSFSDNPTPAMSLAIAGAAVVATGMMFIPVSVLEGLTGTTGLSNLIPALSAPLGDGARALFAYTAGAMTLGGWTILLLQSDGGGGAAQQPNRYSNGFRQFGLKLKNYLPEKMPWVQTAHDAGSFGDASRLGTGDASARVPLRASQDLPILGLAEPTFDGDPIQAAIRRFILPSTRLPVAEVEPDLQEEPSLKEMVDSFEAAVTQRHHQLAEAEASLMSVTEERADGVDMPPLADVAAIAGSEVRRPVLELVSSTAVKDDDADSALAAALATLHRMSANAR